MNFFGTKLTKNISKTPEGYLICRNVPIGRTGTLKYLGEELGEVKNMVGASDSSVVSVYRSPEENSSPKTLASFEGKPITDGHPDTDVLPDNYHYYSKGHIQNVRVEGNYMVADLFVTDPLLINSILSGDKREVSCGYDAVYATDSYGNIHQTQIRGNHLAVVEEGRAGSFVKIKDSMFKECKMAKSKAEKLFQKFVRKVRDAETAEEINDIIEDSAEELEEMVNDAEGVPTPPATTPPAPVPPEGANGGAVSNETIMQMIQELNKKVDGLMGGATSDGTPEGDLDKAVAELEGNTPTPTPEPNMIQDEDLDDPESNLMKDEEMNTPEEENDLILDEDAVGENNGGFEFDEQTKTIMNDSAAKYLKATRKAIASISNPVEKRKVADAAIKAVKSMMKSTGKNSIKNVMKVGNKDAKNKKLDVTAQDCYNKMNPHMNRKYNK